MDTALATAQWAVLKALAPVADGVLEAWEPSKNLGLNIKDLKMELLLVMATLETASRKQLDHTAMEELLQKLRDSVHSADDLLDELDYFRIHDQLHRTYEAADHANGGVHDIVLNARHTAKAVGNLTCLCACWSAASPAEHGEEDATQQASCCAWSRAKQRERGNSSSAPNTIQVDEELGKLPLHIHYDDSGRSIVCGALERNHAEETPMVKFNRIAVSQRMKHITEKLQLVRREFTSILQSCEHRTFRNIAPSRPITTDRSIEPKLYGRDHIVNSIIHDITRGKYCGKDLTVLPVVGPGGIGKTALIQHIYHNQEVQDHFQVLIWISVSLDFDPKRLLEEIKRYSPPVEVEKGDILEVLIEQRLKSKRFLLVLDDIWGFSNEDDWKRLLLPLKQSQEKGSIILVTTRFPAIASMVKTTRLSIELEGLETEEFRKLFFAIVFGDEQCRWDHYLLLEIGDKIMQKLKGSPLAAKTVGRLLRNDLNLPHWRRVLESKEWQRQTGNNDIMPALKLSYDYLPFHQQQCFSYAALFPEDFHFSSSLLINLWIGLDILYPDGQNQRLEDIGLSNLNDLVMHGFFREEETNGRMCYVMNGLLHDLALKVAASHECLSVHLSNMGSVEIEPQVRHLSIIIDDLDDDNAVSGGNFRSELRKLKTRLKVEHLQTLMLFGKIDASLANIFGDLFREANALRVFHLHEMQYPVESMLHNFSAILHLRYLFVGTKDWELMHRFLYTGTEYESQMHLPLTISRFYHLRILDLGSWYDCCDFPKEMGNLRELRHLCTQKDELHSAICDVANLKLLQELKVFRVNKESEGFEPKQLEHLTELRELGIYNLEKIHTQEEASEVKLIEKNYLERLTLDWDTERSNTEPDMEAVVLENLQPHRCLQELCIRGHGGPSCPTWLGDKLAVEALQSLHLVGVSWETFPSLRKMWHLLELVLKHIATMKEFVIERSFCRLRRLELVGLESFEKWVPSPDVPTFPLLQVLIIRDCPKLLGLPFSNHAVCSPEQDWNRDWFPKLQELEIEKCPELFPVTTIPWTETLCSVSIRGIMLVEKLLYSKSSHGVRLDIVGKDDLAVLGQVLAFNNLTEVEVLALVKCPPLELEHLVMLTSLKTLIAESSDTLVGPLGGQGDVEWQLPVEHVEVQELCGSSGKEMTELFTHLPRLSKLEIMECGEITHLAVGVDLQQATLAVSEANEDEIPAPSAAAEQNKEDGVLLFPAHFSDSLWELTISHCPELVLVAPSRLQALCSLQRLKLKETPKFLSSCSFFSPSCCLFPSSLKFLELNGVEGMRTVEPLSNLTSLTLLELRNCGKDLRCNGLDSLLTAGGQLNTLIVYGSPKFFAAWDPNPRQGLHDEGREQQMQHVSSPSSSKLQELWTDDVAGLLAAPICSLLSFSLNQLQLSGTKEMECFSTEQEDALHLLTSLLGLEFFGFAKLQHLPAGLHKLTFLMELQVGSCPSVRSLPQDGLPKLLQKLDVCDCGNDELIQHCRGLVGTIPNIRLEF